MHRVTDDNIGNATVYNGGGSVTRSDSSRGQQHVRLQRACDLESVRARRGQ